MLSDFSQLRHRSRMAREVRAPRINPTAGGARMSATLEPTTKVNATLPDAARNYAITIPIKSRYDNWINGQFRAPVKGKYFSNPTPITGQHLCDVARSTAEDVELAIDAAHRAAPAWGRTSPAARALVINRIADRLEANIEAIAVIETIDNGKPIRESMAADLPLAIDHFRYFAGCLRAQEGSAGELDGDTVAYHFYEPLGVVAQIIPWNFPLLM